MRLRALPLPTELTPNFDRGDWPVAPNEILLHPHDAEILSILAFDYVVVRSDSRITEAGGAEDHHRNVNTLSRVVITHDVETGLVGVPDWIMTRITDREIHHVDVVRATAAVQREAVQLSWPPAVKIHACLAPPSSIHSDQRAAWSRYSEREEYTLSSMSPWHLGRAIIRRTVACPVQVGFLLAVEIFGVTVVIQITCIEANDRRQGKNTSSTWAGASEGGDVLHPDNSAGLHIVMPGTEMIISQRNEHKHITGSRRSEQAPTQASRTPGSGSDEDRWRDHGKERCFPLKYDSLCRGKEEIWTKKAAGLELVLDELHALSLLALDYGENSEMSSDRTNGIVKQALHSSATHDSRSLRDFVSISVSTAAEKGSGRSMPPAWNQPSGPSPSSSNNSAALLDLRARHFIPTSIAICGPSGIGKSLALNILCEDLSTMHGVHVIMLHGPQILGSFRSGQRGGGQDSDVMGEILGNAFDEARRQAPSVIAIDELDTIFDAIDSNESAHSGEGVRASLSVLATMDAVNSIEGVMVLGATRRSPGGRSGVGWSDSDQSSGGDGTPLPSAYQKAGRFERCMEIGPPTQAERAGILRVVLSRCAWELEAFGEAKSSGETDLQGQYHTDDTRSFHSLSGAESDKVPGRRARNSRHHETTVAAWASRISAITPGMVGGDLDRLITSACARANQRCQGELVQGLVAPSSDTKLGCNAQEEALKREDSVRVVLWEDALAAIASTTARSLSGLDVTSGSGAFGSDEKLDWSCIGGYWDAKRRLQSLVQWPWLHPDAFARMGISTPAGALLYGPSGCGKSLVAQVLASECSANFVWVRSSEVLSRYLGETEAKLRAIFAQARAAAPCILFLDELDAITGKRGGTGHDDDSIGGCSVQGRVLSTLLNEMDGVVSQAAVRGRSTLGKQVGGDVLVLAATNRKDALDSALLRPGRFHEAVELGIPGSRDREEILRVHVRRTPLAPDVDLARLSHDDVSGGLSCADLQAACRDAAMASIRENMLGACEVRVGHLEKALQARMDDRARNRLFAFST